MSENRDELAEAEAAFQRHEYAVAIPLLEAVQGLEAARAHLRLGQAYLHGLGVAADPARALTLLASASELGDPKADLELARLCDPNSTFTDAELESIRPKDGQRSLSLARRAIAGLEGEANAGDGEAAFLLAQCYQTSCGVEFSLERALEWLERSFEMGFVVAANELFMIYSQSAPPLNDPERALRFYREAEAAGVRVVYDPAYQRLLKHRS